MNEIAIAAPQTPLTDPGAERAILAAIIIDNGLLREARALEADHFGDPILGAVYAEMQNLRDAGEAINPITLRPVLAAVRTQDGETAKEYLAASAIGGMPPDFLACVNRVLDLARRRDAVSFSKTVRRMASDETLPWTQVADHVRERANQLALQRRQSATRDTFLDHSNRLMDFWKGETAAFLQTGIPQLDARVGGIPLGDFSILAGRTSMGKSAIMQQIALNVSARNEGVLIMSYEMPGFHVTARMVSSMMYQRGMPLPYQDVLMKRPVAPMVEEQFARTIIQHQDLPMIIKSAEHGRTYMDIETSVFAARKEMERFGIALKLVVIDHLGLVQASSRYRGNRVNEMGELSSAISGLARTEGLSILGLAQLNREVEKRESSWPKLSDLRDSGTLEQDANMVMLAYRPAYYLRKELEEFGDETEMTVGKKTVFRVDIENELQERRHDVNIIVDKNRNGPTGNVPCDICIEHNWVGQL